MYLLLVCKELVYMLYIVMEWINVILSSKQAPCFLETLRTSLDAPINTSWYYYAFLVMLFFESIFAFFSFSRIRI